VQAQKEPKKKERELVFMLTEKIKTLKDRVKEKQGDRQAEEAKNPPGDARREDKSEEKQQE
jgi:hypothetical protein